MKPRILVIAGTVRQHRVGRKIADWYIAEARKVAPDLEFEMLDVAELDLPMFNEPIPPLTAQGKFTNEKQRDLAERITAADGFVIVTGEYNHSIPGSLKNFLDYLSPNEWKHRAVAYVGYGTVGGFRAIDHLMRTMTYLGLANVGIDDSIHISKVWEALDENDTPKPEYVRGDVKTQLDELIWWTRLLKHGREHTETE